MKSVAVSFRYLKSKSAACKFGKSTMTSRKNFGRYFKTLETVSFHRTFKMLFLFRTMYSLLCHVAQKQNMIRRNVCKSARVGILSTKTRQFSCLSILIMSRTLFRVNPHSIVAWMSKNLLLEAGAKSEEMSATGLQPATTRNHEHATILESSCSHLKTVS